MLETTVYQPRQGLSRLKLFLALSRTPHGLLDLATPMFAALLCLGTLPPFRVILLGFITAFAGYTAVYALNDLVDYRVDREEMNRSGPRDSSGDLDAVFVRHPIAVGLLSLKEGIVWALSWTLVALAGAYTLNPACALIFILGGILETIYCLLLRVSYMRVLVSGVVKTLGAMAAVFAVEPNPSFPFLLTLFLWLFFWEIGGQNIPNDWADIQEDQQLRAETVPVRFGAAATSKMIFYSLCIATFLSVVAAWLTPAHIGSVYAPGALLSGVYFLLIPGYQLLKSENRAGASALFNRASHYPVAMFVVVLLSFIF